MLPPGAVHVDLVPATVAAAVGDVFTVTVQVRAASTNVAGAQFYLAYDPDKLQVVDMEGVPADKVEPITDPLNVALSNQVQPQQGLIVYAAGSFTGTPTGTFSIARASFKVLPGLTADGTTLDLLTGDAGQKTLVASAERGDITGIVTDARVMLAGG